MAVEFPFTDMQGRKRRPGVVLAGDASDLLLARITTHEPRDSFDVQLDDWTIAGLPKPSTVRLMKLASLATFRGCSLEARCISWSMDSEASSMPLIALAEIIEAARALSPAEQLQLLDAMWDAEHPDAWPVLSPEWLAEVQNRSAAFDAGRMNASPWQDVQARVRRSAGLEH